MTKSWIKEELDTPAVLIHRGRLQHNIAQMAEFAQSHGLALRPHIKTHKMIQIAQMQLDAGAVGITAAKLGEAEAMAAEGVRNILIAYPILGEEKLTRLAKLKTVADVTTVIDGVAQAEALSRFALAHELKFEVLIEVDTGLKRCGVLPGKDTLGLLQYVSRLPGVEVTGIMTHAGHAYGAATPDEVVEIAKKEGLDMVETARQLRAEGLIVYQVSVGATPTVRHSGKITGVTEIRPGNYVFNDLTQIRLGVATEEQCSLRVAARIVSHPAEDRFVIDAGAKTLALDQGAHGTKGVAGFGQVIGHPELTITRLSEEHGVIQAAGPTGLRVGDIIEIIPNHSCPVVNLADHVIVVDDDRVIERWRVTARGRTS